MAPYQIKKKKNERKPDLWLKQKERKEKKKRVCNIWKLSRGFSLPLCAFDVMLLHCTALLPLHLLLPVGENIIIVMQHKKKKILLSYISKTKEKKIEKNTQSWGKKKILFHLPCRVRTHCSFPLLLLRRNASFASTRISISSGWKWNTHTHAEGGVVIVARIKCGSMQEHQLPRLFFFFFTFRVYITPIISNRIGKRKKISLTSYTLWSFW